MEHQCSVLIFLLQFLFPKTYPQFSDFFFEPVDFFLHTILGLGVRFRLLLCLLQIDLCLFMIVLKNGTMWSGCLLYYAGYDEECSAEEREAKNEKSDRQVEICRLLKKYRKIEGWTVTWNLWKNAEDENFDLILNNHLKSYLNRSNNFPSLFCEAVLPFFPYFTAFWDAFSWSQFQNIKPQHLHKYFVRKF